MALPRGFERLIVQAIPDPALALDPDGRIAHANPAAEALFGRSAGGLVGHLPDFVGPGAGQGLDVAKWLSRSAQRPTSRGQEIAGRRADGQEVPLECVLSALETEGGPFALAVFHDLTERQRTEEALRESEERQRRAEEQLRRSEARLGQILESIQDGFFVLDRDWRYTYVNTAAASSSGTTTEALLGKSIWDLAPGLVGGPFHEACQRARGGEVAVQRDVYYEALDKWYDLTIYPFEAGVSVYFRDITAHKHTEQEQQKLISLVENSTDMIGVAALDGSVLYLNEARRPFVGIDSLADVQGSNILDYFAAEEAERVRDEILPALQKDGRWTGEVRFRHWGTGQAIPAELDAFMISDRETGRPIAMASISRDIRERKRAEEALLLFRASVDHASDAIGMSDPDGRHYYQNEAFTALFGEIGEDPPATLYADQALGREVFDTIRSGGRWIGEVRMHARDGRILDVLLRAYANKDDGGRVIGLVGIHTDITERKRAVDALRSSEQRYRTLVHNLPGMAYRCLNDRHWTMLFVSEGIERLTGYPFSDFIDNAVRSYASVIDPDDQDRVDRFVQEGVAARRPYEIEYRLRHRDGRTVWVYEKGQGVYDAAGGLLWLDGVILDITERKRAEEERERLQVQLLQAQKMESIGRLAGGVAHDFNNMLSVILGNAHLALMRLPAGHPAVVKLQEVQRAAERSADLTRQLLAFARRQTVVPRVLDLNETVAATLKMLGRLMGENVELVWQPGPQPGRVKMDPSQLNQLLANLCVNARDAIRDAGRVTIETKPAAIDQAYCSAHPGARPGDYLLLVVRDDGCGMDDETVSHVFEPFFTTKGIGEGTGLGLATVYGIVEQNGGFIGVDSAPGAGTAFSIYLPAYEGGGEAPVTPEAAPPSAGGKETVLVVEDEPGMLETTASMLRELGYTVLTAATPDDALLLARAHGSPIHLLISDVVMPRMNGRVLAEEVRAVRPDLRCLFMSGYTADVIARHGVLEEGVHFLQKPFTSADLARKVRAAMGE